MQDTYWRINASSESLCWMVIVRYRRGAFTDHDQGYELSPETTNMATRAAGCHSQLYVYTLKRKFLHFSFFICTIISFIAPLFSLRGDEWYPGASFMACYGVTLACLCNETLRAGGGTAPLVCMHGCTPTGVIKYSALGAFNHIRTFRAPIPAGNQKVNIGWTLSAKQSKTKLTLPATMQHIASLCR